jgi:DsbC/DsbD-like thiol-disulfide interchange protein
VNPAQCIQKLLRAAAIAALLILPPSALFASQPAVKGPNDSTATVTVEAGDVKARIGLSAAHAFSGQSVSLTANFDIAPGWHIYGTPLPEEYTPTTLTFDDALLARQKLDFPKPTPVKFDVLSETLPVYQGRFKATGDILLRQKLAPGAHQLAGTFSFQECNDNLCKMPQQMRFTLPFRIDPRPPVAAR